MIYLNEDHVRQIEEKILRPTPSRSTVYLPPPPKATRPLRSTSALQRAFTLALRRHSPRRHR